MTPTVEPALADISRRLDELARIIATPPKRYLSPEEAATYLGLSLPLLAKWRCDGEVILSSQWPHRLKQLR